MENFSKRGHYEKEEDFVAQSRLRAAGYTDSPMEVDVSNSFIFDVKYCIN